MCYKRSMEVRKSEHDLDRSVLGFVLDIYISFSFVFLQFSRRRKFESEPRSRKGSINSSRSNVAIFRFIETTHSPFKKRSTYAPMGYSRHQVARGKYQLRVMKPRFSAERYTYCVYIYIPCIVAHSIVCCAITYTYPPFWLIFPGSWINLYRSTRDDVN